MLDKNQIEKIDIISNKIKQINTSIIAVLKSEMSILVSPNERTSTAEHQKNERTLVAENLKNERTSAVDHQKQLAIWKKDFRGMKENIQKLMKDYLHHNRDEVRIRPIKEFPLIAECKGFYRQVSAGQAVQLQFIRDQTTAKEPIYQILVNLYTVDQYNNSSVQNVHRLLKPMMKEILLENLRQTVSKQSITKATKQYFDYWRDINRSKEQCQKCKQVFRFHQEHGFIPPTIMVRKQTEKEYYHVGCHDK